MWGLIYIQIKKNLIIMEVGIDVKFHYVMLVNEIAKSLKLCCVIEKRVIN